MMYMGEVTMVLLYYLSTFVYAYGASAWSIQDLNGTNSYLSFMVVGEKCSEEEISQNRGQCIQVFHGYEKWCPSSCSTDRDCENYRTCKKLFIGKYCHWTQCRGNHDCRNSVCVFENSAAVQGYCYRVCNCGCKGTCRFESNRKKCDCNPGFEEKDGMCRECNCGSKGICRFERGQKYCYCEEGFPEKDGICTECNCGRNGTCKFEKGQKICNCEPGFLENDGMCTECNCGQKGICRFENGKKKCDCHPGFVDKNGTCTDCICKGGACVMEEGKEVCKCPPGFGNYTSTSCKVCDCGPDTNCIWEARRFGGSKICLCKPGYSTKKGKCVACECGPDSNCEFVSEGWLKPEKKVCHCKTGYHEENGKCVDKQDLQRLYKSR